MAKWRVEKDRDGVHWAYPWIVISPEGEKRYWTTWKNAMKSVDIRQHARNGEKQ